MHLHCFSNLAAPWYLLTTHSIHELNQFEDSMDVDLKDFYSRLYSLLPKLCHDSNFHCIPLLLRCLQYMFLDKKQVTVAFIQSIEHNFFKDSRGKSSSFCEETLYYCSLSSSKCNHCH